MGKNSKRHKLLKLFCFSALVAGAFMPFLSSKSCAQMTEGCAADTWVAMTNQAVLQTRREDIINKRYIVKADSVLQYSCFIEDVNRMAATIAPIFNNNEVWAPRDIPNHDSGPVRINVATKTLDSSLQAVVREPLDVYLTEQFPHEVLSNTTPLRQNKFCHDMSAVWQAAKCKNFDGTSVFYKFEDLADFDPREFPSTMPCG